MSRSQLCTPYGIVHPRASRALCALNEQWVMNEKGISALAAHLPLTIGEFALRVPRHLRDTITSSVQPRNRWPGSRSHYALTMLDAMIAEGRAIVAAHLPG